MLDLNTLRERLTPELKKNAEREAKRLEREYKKKREIEMAKKQKSNNDDVPKRQHVSTDLDEIVQLKKKKAVANELDELIWEQEKRKEKRESMKAGEMPPEKPNVVSEIFKEAPEKLKELDKDDIMKLAMINSNGDFNPLLALLMTNMNGNTQERESIVDLVKALKILNEMSKENNEKNFSGNNGTNNMLNTMVTMMILMKYMNPQPSHPPQTSAQNSEIVSLIKELVGRVSTQESIEKRLLMDKLKELEYRTTNFDPLAETTRMIEFMKGFKSLFGGATTPEALKHEIDLEKLRWEQQKEMRKMEESDKRLNQVGNLIQKSIETFSDVFAKKSMDNFNLPKTNAEEVPNEPEPESFEIPENFEDFPEINKKNRFNILSKDGLNEV